MADSLAQTVINIANVLKLSVIAEGVETQAQRDLLQKYGCLLYQGYLYSPPLQPGDFALWVDTHQQQTSTSKAD
jgi:sensor c-di-GMP phosphodiesterase-like protein